jgi:hypothetical protein
MMPISEWWIVRGEEGSLWSTLFLPRGVVAHANQIPRFELNLAYEQRQLAMRGLKEYYQREVNDFLDNLDGTAIIVPDAGSRKFGVGVVTSEPFAGDELHWQQRRCDWYPHLIEAPAGLHKFVTGLGQMGTTFRLPAEQVAHVQLALKTIA